MSLGSLVYVADLPVSDISKTTLTEITLKSSICFIQPMSWSRSDCYKFRSCVRYLVASMSKTHEFFKRKGESVSHFPIHLHTMMFD
jgi:hypothetical protein